MSSLDSCKMPSPSEQDERDEGDGSAEIAVI